mgnify:CR=1 FL=1
MRAKVIRDTVYGEIKKGQDVNAILKLYHIPVKK